MARHTNGINEMLVNLFNHVMDVESKAVITEEFKDITNNDMHIIEAVGIDEPRKVSEIAKILGVTVGTLTTNMNGLEDRISDAFDSIETKINTARAGVQLYSSNGSNGTITLSDNISNYDYLEIYYKEEQAESFHCIKVTPTFKPKWQAMDIRYSSDGYMVFNVKKFTITGTTITQSDGKYANFPKGGATDIRNELHIYILKVKGYKNNI